MSVRLSRRNIPSLIGVVVLCLAVTSAGCGKTPTTVNGRAVSMQYDPNRVAGLPASDGPAGPRVPEPSAIGRVRGTDNNEADRLAVLAVEDIEDYWQQNYPKSLPGTFSPVSGLTSIDPDMPEGLGVCGAEPGQIAFNALYCNPEDVIAWDRAGLLPTARTYFGDLAVNGLLAHEYGHALQRKAGLVDDETPTLISEQQADCFAGVYLRWVAEGESPRFAINTTEALDKVLAGAIAIRDRPTGPLPEESSHGTALDRVSAFQQGFDIGAQSCSAIDTADIRSRRGTVPAELFDLANPLSDIEITPQTLTLLIDVLNAIFGPEQPPILTTESSCAPRPTVYCPDTNTIGVDLDQLRSIGAAASEGERLLLQGDNSAISAVTSRYMLALQHQRGLRLDGDTAAMRTACLTGVAQSAMAESAPSSGRLVLGGGDIDESVSGLLTNGIVASDVSGIRVPSGFTRILAFRSGLSGDVEACYRRFT